MCDALYKTLYKEALLFLRERSGIDGVHDIKCSYASPKINNLKIIYRHLLEALSSTKGIKAATGDIEAIRAPLFEFDPKKTSTRYGDNWEVLRRNIWEEQKDPDMDGHQDYLGIFCKGALSAADLLSQMGSVKGFKMFMDGFYYNQMTMTVLPLLFQMEIGLTFQSACTFLEQVGYPDFVCPDQKVKALWQDIGIIESRNHYEALKTLIMMARANAVTPFEAHLIFLMIATEKLPEQDLKGQLRQPFIEHIIPIINQL